LLMSAGALLTLAKSALKAAYSLAQSVYGAPVVDRTP
jgi:hypothetical protein